jgi:Uncharacterized alpha/beta hydrolase domain (DUF2235)
MKRLVICCDGTWNRPDSVNVTNIEKIARTVHTDVTSTDNVHQLVLYLSGVGVGYRVDRVLGGAFGLGLFTNVLAGYRFLASNYEPGDEIFVFGFSRGAYTARSLVGMIGKVGLLTRRALVEEKLPEAVARYKQQDPKAGKYGQSSAEFKADFCHPGTRVKFLGVFDTVGALGVPGALRKRHQFHDVTLSGIVDSARHALAADEPRMKFEPCLWDAVAGGEPDDPRVRQVWFEGAHTDVGGGYADTGLSDTALLWMVAEAARQGLVFDEELIREYLACGSPAVRHNPMTPLFRLLDLAIRTKIRLHVADGRAFLGKQRRLHRPDCVSVRIAEPTVEHFHTGEYQPANMVAWAETCPGFEGCVEPLEGLPESSYEPIRQWLAEQGVSLEPGQSRPASRSPETASDSVT